jgi:hypothetical protein
MKRVKEGVPVKMLDLRTCRPHPDDRMEAWLQSLSEVVPDVLGPEQTHEAWEHIESMWDTVARGHFVSDDDSSESYDSDTSGDDDEDSEE